MADSKTIYAFVTKGEKFPTCSTFSDKTCDVQCKVTLKQERKLFLIHILRKLQTLTLFPLEAQEKLFLLEEFTLEMIVNGLI